MIIVLLFTIVPLSSALYAKSHRSPSHQQMSLSNALSPISVSQTGLWDPNRRGNTPLDYTYQDYILTKIAGYSDKSYNIYEPQSLVRIQLTYTSLSNYEPPKYVQLGIGYMNFCMHKPVGTISINYTENTVKNITVGYQSDYYVTHIQVATQSSIQIIGKPNQSQTNRTINISGVLVGVQARTSSKVNDINFKYKLYSHPLNLSKLYTLSTNQVMGNQSFRGYVAYNLQIPDYYITKIVGYNDRQYAFNPLHLFRVQFTFTSLNGKPPSVQSIGIGYNPVDKQQVAGTINIDYNKTLVKRVILGFDQTVLTSFQLITTDGISQKFASSSLTTIRYTTFEINGYLVGVAGSKGTDVKSMQLKYKVAP